MEANTEIDKNEFILNHIVLPRYLPSKEQRYSNELELVKIMLINAIATRTLPVNTMRLFQKLKRIYIDSKEDTLKNTLAMEIRTLQGNDTFAMFVPHQNCTLILRQTSEKLILATFHSDTQAYEVYSHNRLDLQVKCLILKFQIFARLKCFHG